jgi:hypothetical protein
MHGVCIPGMHSAPIHFGVLLDTSLNPVPNAQVCIYLTIHITKLQLQTDENINIVIEFNPYVPKFSKSKTQAPNRNLQIILIIRHINVEPKKVVP